MKSPFKFLDSYTKNDRDIFFGREREIEELYHRVFESKIMLVYGVSGTGKSSLIHCGLANKFRETDWLPIVIRRGGNIIESMAAGIKASSITQQQDKFINSSDFKKGIRSLYLDYYKPIFFIFDQFEELYIFGNKEERLEFVQIVKSLIESDLQCRLIFVMREEYIAGVTEFEKYIPTFFANRVRIEKMSHLNALHAIEEPCKVFNISLEEGFAEALLEKLSPGSEDVELTYLQVFLDKIFRLSVNEKKSQKDQQQLSFTEDLLNKIGDVSDLLGSFLDDQISLLDDPDTGLAVLKSFVSAKGTKRQMSPKEVSEYSQTLGKPIEDSILQKMLQTYTNRRILRDKDQNNMYELRHDALASKIYEKITLVEKERIEIRQFIENAFNNFQRRKIFLSASDLSYIAPYQDKMYLSDPLFQFIEQSRNEINFIKRRKRNFLTITVILFFVIFAGFTIWALKEKRKADEASVRQIESILKLNESFEKVKRNQVKRKDEIYQQFLVAYKTSPVKLRELWNKALYIQKASNELTEFIYQLEYKMISKTENIPLDSAQKINLVLVKNKSNTDIPNQILFGTDNKNGPANVFTLKQKIQNYKKAIYNQIDKKDWDKISFGIETEKPVFNQKGDSVSWEEANFRESVLVGSVTNLHNLITEINYIEIDAVNLIYSWIAWGSFEFNTIQPTVISKNNSVLSGENYEATVLLSAYNRKLNMEAYILEGKESLSDNDIKKSSSTVPFFSENGKIKIKIPANRVGLNKYAGYVSLRKSDGDYVQYQFADVFYVLEPAIMMTPTGGNVLYRGIDNLIDISVPGISSDKIKFKIVNGILNRNEEGKFIFRPGDADITIFTITVDINNKPHSFSPMKFRIIDTPDPVAGIGNNKGGDISCKDILTSTGLNAQLTNFHFDLKYAIKGFTILTQDIPGHFIEEKTSGSAFSEIQKTLLLKLKPGDYLFIKDISALGPEGKIRKLNDLIYKIVKE